MRTHSFALAAAGLIVIATPACADIFTGTLFYTDFDGGQNVNKVDYSYNDVTFSLVLSNKTNIASSPGADGIVFSPNGNLLIGGAGAGRVYEYTTGGTLVASGDAKGSAYHESLDPSGTSVWTSTFRGPLVNLPISPNVSDPVDGSPHAISGDERGVTQIVFAPNGNVFYVNGNPNGFGNVGLIDMSTFKTDQIFSGITSAHGIQYDSYTGLITLFGAGAVGTFKTDGDPLSLKQRLGIAADFDQGSVDGKGHAFIAGASSLTFIDYRASGDITNASNHTFVVGGFTNIDDLAPLSGLGSSNDAVPEPASLLMWGIFSSATAVLGYRRRRYASS